MDCCISCVHTMHLRQISGGGGGGGGGGELRGATIWQSDANTPFPPSPSTLDETLLTHTHMCSTQMYQICEHSMPTSNSPLPYLFLRCSAYTFSATEEELRAATRSSTVLNGSRLSSLFNTWLRAASTVGHPRFLSVSRSRGLTPSWMPMSSHLLATGFKNSTRVLRWTS